MAEATRERPTTQGETLKKELKMRHMTMIPLGGVIGAGLFVGGGTVIGAVGPTAVSSFVRSQIHAFVLSCSLLDPRYMVSEFAGKVGK